MSKKESRYYVEYLGWKESRGLFGREFTEPIVSQLLARRRTKDNLPKMTIKLNPTELQISQEKISNSDSRPLKTKYPPIPTKDVTFVIQSLYPDSDVVACIFLGYNPYTKCAVHVHVYRFASASNAEFFVGHINSIIETPDFKQRVFGIEKDLADLGHVTIRRQLEKPTAQRKSSGSDGQSYDIPSPHSSDSLSPQYPTASDALKSRVDILLPEQKKPTSPDPNVKQLFSTLHEELEYRINLDDGPILLPPKDYDTIVRRHGNLDIRKEVKATSRSIVGPNGIFSNMAAQPYVGQIGSNSSDSGHSQDSADAVLDYQTHNGSYLPSHQHMNGGGKVSRSNSDTNTQLHVHDIRLQRQSSFASSEQSNNSDDFFADGLYQGYKPKAHRRSRSKDEAASLEDSGQFAMWSPFYSFGQNGVRPLHTHHEEESHSLSRTAPAGMLPHRKHKDKDKKKKKGYVIREQNDHGYQIKRSNSHKHKASHDTHYAK